MTTILMQHPKHGRMHVYSEPERETAEARGWAVVEPVEAPEPVVEQVAVPVFVEPEPAPEVALEPEPVITPQAKRTYKRRK